MRGMWTDGPFACTFENEAGDLVAQVIKSNSGEWGAFNSARLNSTQTGPLLVKGGFRSADEAKAFVDQNMGGEGWQ